MGCDIHIGAEIRIDGKWQFVPGLVEIGRNYDIFGVLADVRNGVGFAGYDTGDGFVPMSQPKGIPDDASSEYVDVVEQWGNDGHSHSYHTLQEMLDYDFTQSSVCRGLVRLDTYKEWKKSDETLPKNYFVDVMGENVVKITEEEYNMEKDRFEEMEETGVKNVYIHAGMPVDCIDHFDWFIDDVLNTMKDHADSKKVLHDDIRIVFFFDS